MKFELPTLNYVYNALEPILDAQTMEIHYTKHHQTYINNLNKALEAHQEINLPIEEMLKGLSEIPEDIRLTVQNNGGGYLNHKMFWDLLCPVDKSKISDNLKIELERHFGSLEDFKTKFQAAGLARFGSGWLWLVKNDDKLEIITTANQDNPISINKLPILGIDVWEHAYYLKYQNRRNEYLENIWQVINWNKVEELLNA